MGRVQLAEGELNYRLDGPQGAPVLVLSNSLGTDLGMWDTQVPAFAEHFQVLRYDTRGHGQSLVTEGPYSIEQLGGDVLALLDALHIERAHFCGLSMGGLIGQWLGIHAGSRLHKLIVCNTAAKIGDPSVWNPRIEMVLRDGAAAMAGLRDASIARWFTADFAQANPEQAKRITDMLAATSPKFVLKALGGKRWQWLHRAVYATVPLALLHFFWMRAGKNNFAEVAVYAAILSILLTWRAVRAIKK